MILPIAILEDKNVVEYLVSRNIVKQYQKSKNFLLSGIFAGTNFGERQPKGSNIWYFRINKQYRALGSFDDKGQFRVFEIDDHQ